MPTPDIELTEREQELFDQIQFDKQRHENIQPVAALAELLMRRGAIPEVRRLYFTDPERNPSGRGKSRQAAFEKEGSYGPEILEHPNYMQLLEYFMCGPNLPAEVIAEFKDAARFSGRLTGGDVVDLIPTARAAVRLARLNPYEASNEFHKLVLECGAMPSRAESMRNAIRWMKVT